MNSAGLKYGGWLLALALSVAGCSDHGPTNLYSQPLFGDSKGGAKLVVHRVDAVSLSPSAGSDAYRVILKNIGTGSAAGPIQGRFFTSLTGCATTLTYGNAMATAQFASKGEVIAPGDTVQGYAVDAQGVFQSNNYALYANYNLSSCAGTNVVYSLDLSDPFGGSWSTGFTAVAQ